MRRFKKSHYPRQIKTIPIRARDGDSGREVIDKGSYFRCWNCGFICDERRDKLSSDGRRGTVLSVYVDSVRFNYTVEEATGVEYLADGTYYADGTVYAGWAPGWSEREETVNYTLGDIIKLSTGVGKDIVLIKDNTTIYHVYTVGGTGCPLCHTTVWKKP